MTPDDKRNAETMLDLFRSAGLTVNVTRDRLGNYHVTTTDEDGQRYELTGDNLYYLSVELAKQVGFQDID